MHNKIFYSWQSDLPNNTNRGFLESCIKRAINELKGMETFSIELTLDKDTKNITGTPDITESIFKKIDNTKVFIADISIINSKFEGRKTPNPNVLIELGYASKSIGWDKVICLYNLDYGSLDDLPFDLRQRRIITYSLKHKQKSEIRNEISSKIVDNMKSLYETGGLKNIINDYIKVQVDTEILTIINHLNKIVFGYSKGNSFDSISKFLNLREKEIVKILKNSNFIGFQIFKKLEINESNLRQIVDKTISSSYHEKEPAGVIIELVRWIAKFDKFNSLRINPNLFQSSHKKANEFKVVSGYSINKKNIKFPDRFLLLKIIDAQHGKVQDFGDFIEKHKIEKLQTIFTMNPKNIEEYTNLVLEFIHIVEKWLDNTNGEFIIDNAKMFEIKNIENQNG